MSTEYAHGLVGCDVNIKIAPSMEEPAVLKMFAGLRRSLSILGLTHFEHEQEEKVCRLNNGGNMDSKEERVVKLTMGSDLQVIWGPNTPLDIGKEISRITTEDLIQNIEIIQIESFNSQLYIDVDSTGNAYDRIAALAYSENIIGAFLKAMSEATDGFHVADNDVRLLFFIGESQTGAISIRGKTTKKEILTGQYDNDPLRLFFGIQETRIPDSPDAFIAALLAHISRVNELARDVFFPTVVAKCGIQPAGAGDAVPRA